MATKANVKQSAAETKRFVNTLKALSEMAEFLDKYASAESQLKNWEDAIKKARKEHEGAKAELTEVKTTATQMVMSAEAQAKGIVEKAEKLAKETVEAAEAEKHALFMEAAGPTITGLKQDLQVKEQGLKASVKAEHEVREKLSKAEGMVTTLESDLKDMTAAYKDLQNRLKSLAG